MLYGQDMMDCWGSKHFDNGSYLLSRVTAGNGLQQERTIAFARTSTSSTKEGRNKFNCHVRHKSMKPPNSKTHCDIQILPGFATRRSELVLLGERSR